MLRRKIVKFMNIDSIHERNIKCKLVSRHIYLSTVQAKESSELQVNMFQECPPYLNTLEL